VGERLVEPGCVTYAGAEFWDPFYRRREDSGNDLDWKGLWTAPFLIPLPTSMSGAAWPAAELGQIIRPRPPSTRSDCPVA
jgi:hypothetical protein